MGAAEDEEATYVVVGEEEEESGEDDGEERRLGTPLSDGNGNGGRGEECLPAGRPKCKYGMDCYRQ